MNRSLTWSALPIAEQVKVCPISSRATKSGRLRKGSDSGSSPAKSEAASGMPAPKGQTGRLPPTNRQACLSYFACHEEPTRRWRNGCGTVVWWRLFCPSQTSLRQPPGHSQAAKAVSRRGCDIVVRSHTCRCKNCLSPIGHDFILPVWIP